jgi:soluble epoxide hydrolase / lipid-phosphate phosphatase
MPGYCETESPLPFEYYTAKRIATDIVSLVGKLGISKAVYIGHDWGSFIVQRLAFWFPKHVLAVGSICVPFTPTSAEFISIEKMVEMLPNFTYQLWFASPDCEQQLSTPDKIERFLNGVYRSKDDKPIGITKLEELVDPTRDFGRGKIWENDKVFQYYLKCFVQKGSLRGPLTYYKVRGLNYRDELEIVDTAAILCPALFVGAKFDVALPPAIWENQQWVPKLERYSVDCSHWCLVEDQGRQVNPLIERWVAKVSTSAKL